MSQCGQPRHSTRRVVIAPKLLFPINEWVRPASINTSDTFTWSHYNRSMKAILSKAVLAVQFKVKNVGSLVRVLLAAILLAQAQPASTPVLRSFDRVLLLEEKGETSAGVSVGDINGDGEPDTFSAKGG